jgi:signal transduction histidine kinase
MHSIRRDVSVRLLGGAALVFVGASALLAVLVHERLVAGFDQNLETKARALSTMSALDGNLFEFECSPEQLAEFTAGEYLQVRLQNGFTILRTKSLGGLDLPPAPSPDAPVQFHNLSLPDGRRGRTIHLIVQPRLEPDEPPEHDEPEPPEEDEINVPLPPGLDPATLRVHIAVARDREGLDAVLYWFYAFLLVVQLAALGGLTLLVRHAVRRGLRPVAAINDQITRIQPPELDRRIQVPDPPEELRAIVATMNDLLARLQAAFERERRFSSNVAHELRTSVAELRAASEVAALLPDDVENLRRLAGDFRTVAGHMEGIVTNLLLLSRCENESEAVIPAPVRVREMVDAARARSAGRAAARDLQWDVAHAGDDAAFTDPQKLAMIVQNLLENAVAHAVAGTTVRVRTRGTDRGVEFTVTNAVENLDPADVAHFAEPFWRKDRSRSSSEHTGLGLSIVQALCGILGLDLRLALRNDREFIAQVMVPLADPSVDLA